MTITFTIPIRTRNHSNEREHWATRAKRTKAERQAVQAAWLADITGKHLLSGGPLYDDQRAWIHIERIAPRPLDSHDGLRSALKGVVDQLATCLGFDKRDNDPRLTWVYSQTRGKPKEYGVRVTVEILPAQQPAEVMG